MHDLNLDDLLANNSTPEPPLPVPNNNDVIPKLSHADRQKVDSIKNSIDFTNSANTINFGSQPQAQIAQFADSILSKVRSKDSGDVGNILNDLVSKVKGFQPADKKSFVSKIPFFGSLVDSGHNILAGYDKLSSQVDKISRALDLSKVKLLEDVQMFEILYQKNLQYFHELDLYIIAGDEKLNDMRSITLPKLKAQAQASSDPMASQVVADFENLLDRFEKKIHDLKLSKTIAIQTAPQIRLIQNNDKVLVERVQSAIFHTIPLWKNQIVIALGLSHQNQVIQMQRAVADATNDLLLRNSQMLKQNTIDTARENERGIVDIDTVKKVNDDLIATIEETVKIQQEGRAKRAAAEKELVAIEAKLKDALLRNSNRIDNNG